MSAPTCNGGNLRLYLEGVLHLLHSHTKKAYTYKHMFQLTTIILVVDLTKKLNYILRLYQNKGHHFFG